MPEVTDAEVVSMVRVSNPPLASVVSRLLEEKDAELTRVRDRMADLAGAWLASVRQEGPGDFDRALQFCAQALNEALGTEYGRMGWPEGLPLPWGSVVLVEIPEEFWSDDYLRGVWSKTFIGRLCDHAQPDEGKVCVQPARESQAEGCDAPCMPFDLAKVRITAIPGKLADYGRGQS